MELYFPDDWVKGRCDKCPYREEENGCKLDALRGGWCQLKIKSNNAEKNSYNRGYEDGYRKGYRMAVDSYEEICL